jgi:hypothetical protein
MRKATAYETPVVRDYGDLVELTRASGFVCQEDGGSKLTIHHVSQPGTC